MKFKKLISMVVTAAMVFALAAPAFAFGGGATSGSTGSTGSSGTEEDTVAVDSTIKTPTVKVTVPTAGAVILNPYQMKFTVDGNDKTDPFYSAPIICKNESDCDLDVAVKATATAEGEVVITAADSVDTDEPGAKNVSLTLTTGKFAAEDSTAHTANTTTALDLEASGTEYGFGADGDETETPLTMPYSEDPTYFGFILTGKVNKKTTNVWAETDKVSVTIVLTFTPQAIAANNPRTT
ncbi:MAG: hypothetical protein IJR54_07490 [Oscillibacter sp.]|nr:hypothetical protein [Oscillibacter sp.]